MSHTYKIMSVDADGNPLSPEALFDAWVVMARDLAAALPSSSNRELCQAVHEAVESDRARASGKVFS